MHGGMECPTCMCMGGLRAYTWNGYMAVAGCQYDVYMAWEHGRVPRRRRRPPRASHAHPNLRRPSNHPSTLRASPCAHPSPTFRGKDILHHLLFQGRKFFTTYFSRGGHPPSTFPVGDILHNILSHGRTFLITTQPRRTFHTSVLDVFTPPIHT